MARGGGFGFLLWTALSAFPGLCVVLGLYLVHLLAPAPAVAGIVLILFGAILVALTRERFAAPQPAAAAEKVVRVLPADAAQAVKAAEDKAAAAARERNQIVRSYVAVLDLVPDAVVILDRLQYVLIANQAALDLFGAEIGGRALSSFMRNPQVNELVEGVLIEGQPAGRVDFEIPVPVARQFRCTVIPVPKERALNMAAGLIFRDVTDILRGERMRADFVANASHEIRTPLAAVSGFIETLRGPARDDPAAREHFLKLMNDQVERIIRLVNDLLSLSRIELSEHTAPKEQVRIDAVVRRVLANLDWKVREKETTVELDLPESLPPVTGDANELEQVFQNLIDNAIKYGRPKGRVRVAAFRETAVPAGVSWPKGAGVLAVSVHDDGVGIAREHLPRLTERFYRVDTARSRDMGGTGLGLAIAKHIVSRHRGALTIDSEIGQGSTFTVQLPIQPEG